MAILQQYEMLVPLTKGQLWYNGQVPNEQFVYKTASQQMHYCI